MFLLGIKWCMTAQTSSHSNDSVNIKSKMSSFPIWFLLRVSDIKSETMAFMSGSVFRQIYSECQRASIKIWWVLTTENSWLSVLHWKNACCIVCLVDKNKINSTNPIWNMTGRHIIVLNNLLFSSPFFINCFFYFQSPCTVQGICCGVRWWF